MNKINGVTKMNHKYTCPYFTFSTRGTTVHYELYEHDNKTERPTFVLVHGFLSSSFSYRRLIPLLAKEGTVIALDLPPFGKVISLICLSILITI